jgi:hypothetical protein
MPKIRSLGCIAATALTILAAIALLVVSSVYVHQTTYLSDLWTQVYALSIYSLVISILAILFGFALIYVVNRQFPALTTLFSGSLILIAFLSVICAIILITGRNDLQTNSYKNTVQLFSNYSDSDLISNSDSNVNRIQQTFKCCGVEKATYWEDFYSDKTSTPDSCCKKIIPDCGNGSLVNQDNIYLRGCAEPIYNELRYRYDVLTGLNFTLMALSIISAILGVIFERHIREQYQIM